MALIETVDLWKTYVMGARRFTPCGVFPLPIERGDYVAIWEPSGSGSRR